MENTKPSDYLPLKTWFYEYGKPVFNSDKLLHYHTKPIQRELIEAGAMARLAFTSFCTSPAFGRSTSASSPGSRGSHEAPKRRPVRTRSAVKYHHTPGSFYTSAVSPRVFLPPRVRARPVRRGAGWLSPCLAGGPDYERSRRYPNRSRPVGQVAGHDRGHAPHPGEIQPTSVRSVCYQLFNAKLIDSMAKANTNAAGRLLRQAREDGLIPWEWVVDESREAERASLWRDPDQIIDAAVRGYRRDYWQDQPVHIEVWSEKGTVRGTLAPVLDAYETTFRVMHGFASATVMNDVADLTRLGPVSPASSCTSVTTIRVVCT